MEHARLQIDDLGPVRRADIRFGDLTVFVGPQASGKSITLQVLKLIGDTAAVRKRLRDYGVDWDSSLPRFVDVFFGEGMQRAWYESTRITINGESVTGRRFLRGGERREEASVVYVPAQRALTLRDGWPRPFSDYSPGDPYVVREFSERLRLILEGGLGRDGALFPASRLKVEQQTILNDALFRGFSLLVDRSHLQRRLVLAADDDGTPLPVMVWSTGQREFVPLLLGLYWLLPSVRSTKQRGVDWVIIEEPEMGLHPRAISAVMLLVMELLWRGYRVCLSTHSPQVLDLVWALRVLRERRGTARDLLSLFGCEVSQQMRRVADAVLKKTCRVYLFPADGETRDISQLDPGSDDQLEAEWGGLTDFASRAGEVVARVVSRDEQRAR